MEKKKVAFPSMQNYLNMRPYFIDLCDMDISDDDKIGKLIGLDYVEYTKPISEYIQACYDNGFQLNWNYSDWMESNQDLIERCIGLEDCSLEDIARLTTIYLRGEHMCTGYISDKARKGILKKYSKRAIQLIDESQESISAEEAIKEITKVINMLKNQYGKNRTFALDGRLIGDIGEVVAAEHYSIILNSISKKGFDAIVEDSDRERKVQVKVTLKDRLTFPTNIEDVPEIYLGLQFNEHGIFSEIYNGPGINIWNSIARSENSEKVKSPYGRFRTISVSKLTKPCGSMMT